MSGRKSKSRDKDVAAVFDAYPDDVRKRLLELRDIIFDTARDTPGIGTLEETLKWGQPAYFTRETKSGSTIRLGGVKGAPNRYALFFHCQTSLGEAFRERYGDVLNIQDDRSIVFDAREPLPEHQVRHCVALALTYHLTKRQRRTA